MKRTAQIFFVTCFCLFLLGVGVLTAVLPKESGSFYENRSLAPFPEARAENVLSGDFFTDLETYLTDHVPLRSYLLKGATLMRLDLLHQDVVSDVIDGDEVLLGFHGYSQWDTGYLLPSAQEAAKAILPWQEAATSYGGQVYYLGVPEQYSYFQDRYPGYMEDRAWLYPPTEEAMEAALREANIPFLSLYNAYRDQGCPEDYYFATDHHYTIYGALRAAQVLLEAVNEGEGWDLYVPRAEDLTFTELPNPFLGSRNRKLYALRYLDDRLTTAVYTDPIPFTRSDNGEAVSPSLLALPETEDEVITYSVFMGGDIGETVLSTDREDLPTALLIGESYTNALETLLYASFDELHTIDPRSFEGESGGADVIGDITGYIEALQPDVVIVMRDNSAYLKAVGG